MSESKRLDLGPNKAEVIENDEQANDEIVANTRDRKRPRQKEVYDEEVYDDRPFYSMLLKTFIVSSNNQTTGMRKEDILAMQKYKHKNNKVDRKASKGRKVRYILHPKLQNFMFPMKQALADDVIDDRLFNSLFQ